MAYNPYSTPQSLLVVQYSTVDPEISSGFLERPTHDDGHEEVTLLVCIRGVHRGLLAPCGVQLLMAMLHCLLDNVSVRENIHDLRCDRPLLITLSACRPWLDVDGLFADTPSTVEISRATDTFAGSLSFTTPSEVET